MVDWFILFQGNSGMRNKLALLLVMSLAAGCDQPAEPVEQPASPSEPIEINEAPPPPLSGHDHPDHGPHNGTLIELGGEDYHAELVQDKQAALVTVYLLDRSAEMLMPIEATEVTLNLIHGGQPKQFKLTASPEETDPTGQSSRFTLTDPQLLEALDHEKSEARLVVLIKGLQYTGKVEHHH